MDLGYLRATFGLEGQTAVVTGASRGLGASMALALARAGARVLLVGRKPNLGASLAAIEAAGGEAAVLVVDYTAEETPQHIVDDCLERWGRLDVLVSNAGTFHRQPAAEVTMERWDQVVDLNLRFLFALSQAAGRVMMERGRGKIIHIASVLGFQGGKNVPAYAASRHGVLGLTKALANEWAVHGVNVNAIAPGYMDTEQNEALFRDPQRSAELLARVPAGRWGRQDEIDGACLFLASAASDFVHGTTLMVDGGWLAR